MAEEEVHKPRAASALALIDMALEHSSSSAKTAALIILSLEADAWFKFSAIELVNLDSHYRVHANNVLLGVQGGDFQPSLWLERLGIDVKEKVSKLITKWDSLRVKSI
ncbi:hypothetical protein OCF84_21405 (plasmid) [Shewanella xiamenensis]|uniref:Uncharacterized protein n=1 Tax=Shewanella xiamenensis TaxID=332186 RepID=A0ABT6UDM1_9GAMM|nr:hypothetical protein [Shewanella xiamenensis]MDI5832566.1 hypothetical protein [Shewanella xiamenensis]WHF57816.1 hypothetical protein OCF84_21405 [Shewanella xiamenensis]